MTLGLFISLYIVLTVLLGIYAAKYVVSTRDYCLAGRKLSLLLCSSTMFSTWFGSETIIGASSEFLQHGFLGVIEDPFGTSLGFILIGLFVAKPIYRLNVLTIVDFYRIKFGRKVEIVSAVFMILSYFGWIAAQFLAMAIILNVVLGIPVSVGIMLSMSIVCLYTICGGMWSISINDFVQTVVIAVGLFFIALYIFKNHNPLPVISHVVSKDFFRITPPNTLEAWAKYITAWMTIGLGSIPQQDVFQRVMSAKSERVAVNASYVSGVMYLCIGMLPMFVALCLKVTDPSLQDVAPDQVLLQAILQHDSVWIKVLFFGALLSAIMSSASGAVLAPATILGENILKPFCHQMSDRTYLGMLRLCVLITAIISGLYACFSENVYALVAESSIISLVSLFVPLVAGLYWSKATTAGAFLSIILGPAVWGLCVYTNLEVYSAILGLCASTLGMGVGYLLQPKQQTETTIVVDEEEVAALW